MTQSSCKRHTKSKKSSQCKKLAPVRVFSCKHPLTHMHTHDPPHLATLDVPSKHVWKIKQSCYVYAAIYIVAVV